MIRILPQACGLTPQACHQRPSQESNLAFDLRRVACDPPHSKDENGESFQFSVFSKKNIPN